MSFYSAGATLISRATSSSGEIVCFRAQESVLVHFSPGKSFKALPRSPIAAPGEREMERQKAFFQIAVMVILALALGCLAGCATKGGVTSTGGSSGGTGAGGRRNRRHRRRQRRKWRDRRNWWHWRDRRHWRRDPGGGASVGSLGSHIVVTDSYNHRALIYDAPFTNNQSAAVVLGQPDFVQRIDGVGRNATANTMTKPVALSRDSSAM